MEAVAYGAVDAVVLDEVAALVLGGGAVLRLNLLQLGELDVLQRRNAVRIRDIDPAGIDDKHSVILLKISVLIARETRKATDIWLCTPASRRGLFGRIADKTSEKAKKSSFPAIFTAFYANRRNAERKAGNRIFAGKVRQNGWGGKPPETGKRPQTFREARPGRSPIF